MTKKRGGHATFWCHSLGLHFAAPAPLSAGGEQRHMLPCGSMCILSLVGVPVVVHFHRTCASLCLSSPASASAVQCCIGAVGGAAALLWSRDSNCCIIFHRHLRLSCVSPGDGHMDGLGHKGHKRWVDPTGLHPGRTAPRMQAPISSLRGLAFSFFGSQWI